ncbi:MAG: hypothetical protein IKL47_12750 [Clostridia bacterium]|nr:hypothetical protein [Clostridia bacterium]
MNNFIIASDAIKNIGNRVSKVVKNQDYTKQPVNMGIPNCGCGAGGSCSDSCVEGCAERGSRRR